MNLEHKEKQDIFDSYAKEQGYKNWMEILLTFKSYEFSISVFNKHIFNATDLVQKKALERASTNVMMKLKENHRELDLMDEWMEIDKESITNENNIIK